MRAARRFLLAAFTVLVALAVTPEVGAQTPAPKTGRTYSPFEAERIRRALQRLGGEVDPEPQGKRIEAIRVVALEVFEKEDPQPHLLNWFHVTTRNYIVEREVLFQVGSLFDQRRSDETERNLRSLFLFSVVLALPLRGSSEDSVRYVVITKDIWSLRVGWNLTYNDGAIEALSLQPTESNLFGTGRRAFGTLAFNNRTFSAGLGYVEPRLAGSRTRIVAQYSLILSCESGKLEGSSASFQYARPLYSTLTRWSYSTSVSWSKSRGALFFRPQTGSICSAPTDELAGVPLPTGRVAVVPAQYQFDSQNFTQSFTRSYGYRYKTNLSFGMEATRRASSELDLNGVRAGASDVPGDLSEDEILYAQLDYRARLPRSDQRISPFFQISSFTTHFHRDINSETLALQEDVDFRLGHVATLRIYPALEALGSRRNLLGIRATASYATSVGTGYFKARVTHNVELSSPENTDASLVIGLRFTSPRLALGRFVYDARLSNHYRNFTRTVAVLDTGNRLRGYVDNAVVGAHFVAGNLEFRTSPVELFGAQFAAAAFHDMGDAFNEFGDASLRHGVGLGLRFLAPQLDREVFRVDLALPVPLDAEDGKAAVFATFGQAFGLP